MTPLIHRLLDLAFPARVTIRNLKFENEVLNLERQRLSRELAVASAGLPPPPVINHVMPVTFKWHVSSPFLHLPRQLLKKKK